MVIPEEERCLPGDGAVPSRGTPSETPSLGYGCWDLGNLDAVTRELLRVRPPVSITLRTYSPPSPGTFDCVPLSRPVLLRPRPAFPWSLFARQNPEARVETMADGE